MNTITHHHGKAAKTMTFDREILDYVLYIKALGNDATSSEIIFKQEGINETFREKS